MYILSYDVASKSLAMSIIWFNENWQSELSGISKSFENIKAAYKSIPNKTSKDQLAFYTNMLQHIERMYSLLDTLITPIIADVVDLIPAKKLKDTNSILRAARLKGYLEYVDGKINSIARNEKVHVLVEYQMGPNNKSNNVCSQLIYHYSCGDMAFKNAGGCDLPAQSGRYTIEIVGPSLKNKLNLDCDKPRQFFIDKYMKTYDANKKHSIANMLAWLETKNMKHIIANIKKSNWADIADSITMTLAWIYIKSGLL